MLLIRQPMHAGASRPMVVCVGQDTATLSAVAGALASDNVDLVLTHDGEEAVELAHRGRADVVITGQQLNGMSGCVLLRSIARLSPRTGRVMLAEVPDATTAYEQSLGTVECLLAPPWAEQELRGALERMLARRTARADNDRSRTA